MSKIIGVTVGTPMSVSKIKEKLNMTADEVKFSDGETFQQKYDSGELKGSDGVGVRSVTQTTTSNADGGTNIITVTKTDGSTSTFSVKNGAAGKTPVRGTDYWTAADKAAMVNDVLAALPTWTGGSY